jgi:nitrite reductase/ring-hydroxylating ferredoxin subunit
LCTVHYELHCTHCALFSETLITHPINQLRPHPPALIPTQAASWTKVDLTKQDLSKSEGRAVVEVNGQKILVAEVDGNLYAVSNKCTHLNLPLVGKTAIFQGKVADKCIVCPAHGTAFDLQTGAVKGEWCPGFPDLPFVGKGTASKPLPTFEARVDAAGAIEILA